MDSRFHGNDGGGRTGIPAPRAGLDAWIPVFTGMTGGGEDGYSCSTGGVGRGYSCSTGGVGRVDSCSLVGVRRVDSRHTPSLPPCHSRENGNPRDCPRHSPPHPATPRHSPLVIPVKTGIHAIAPGIPATPRHPRHTPSLPLVIPVKTGIHAIAPVIPATPRHPRHTPSSPLVIPVKTGMTRGDDGHSCSTGGVGRVDSRFHGNDGGRAGAFSDRGMTRGFPFSRE